MASLVPVISGVGHETDFTICDFAADLRAPTPSAAAEMVSRPDADWQEEVETVGERLESAVRDVLEEKKRRIGELAGSYVFRETGKMVEMSAQRVDELAVQLQRGLGNAWLRKRRAHPFRGHRRRMFWGWDRQGAHPDPGSRSVTALSVRHQAKERMLLLSHAAQLFSLSTAACRSPSHSRSRTALNPSLKFFRSIFPFPNPSPPR